MSDVRYLSSFSLLLLSPDEALQRELAGFLKPFGYLVTAVTDGMEGLERIRTDRPDMIIADVALPPLSGFELCQSVKQDPVLKLTPVILVASSYFQVDEKVQALSVGADDIIYRPVHGGELRARVRASLRLKAYTQQLIDDKQRFEELVGKRSRELEQTTMGVVAALEKAVSLNDEDSGAHIRRVCEYSALLGRELGLESVEVERIRHYASLHDVGKVGLPDAILKKRGKLTVEEFEMMKHHTTFGHELLVAANVHVMARNIALGHHEWYNGRGYPGGLEADQIPVEARVVTLADVYDAMTTVRCYKSAMSPLEAAGLIVRASGTQFDPGIVRVFMKHHGGFMEIRNQHQDEPVPALSHRT
ncbi:MAG: HD domain-containing phosphohydrolase [Pseudomonadota bacterium]